VLFAVFCGRVILDYLFYPAENFYTEGVPLPATIARTLLELYLGDRLALPPSRSTDVADVRNCYCNRAEKRRLQGVCFLMQFELRHALESVRNFVESDRPI